MATSPAPDAAAPPGMCPGIAAKGGGGGNGDGSGDGDGGKEGADGDGKGKGDGAGGEDSGGGKACGDPVCPISGRMFVKIFDFGLGGPFPLRFTRGYSSRASNVDGELGYGWGHTYGWRIRIRRQSIDVYDGFAGHQVLDPLDAQTGTTKNSLGWEIRKDGAELVLRRPQCLEVYRFSAAPGDGTSYRLSSVSDQHGNTIRVERDPQGRLTAIVDSVGRPIRFATDSAGRILQAYVPTEPTHQQWMEVARYTYDDQGNLASATDAEGYTGRYAYDRHLMVEHLTPSGLSYFYRYDGRNHEAYCVETWGEYPGAVDPALDEPIPPRPASGPDRRRIKGIHYVRLTFDKPARYTEVEDGLGGITRYFGDAASRVVKIVRPSGAVIERAFDPATGQLVGESDSTGAPRKLQTPESGPPEGFSGPDGPRARTEFTPDEEIRTDLVTGAVTVSRYSERHDLVFRRYADGTTEEWWYDDRGCLQRFINRQGAVTSFLHDAMGRCVQVVYPGGGVERREYDYLSRMTAMIDPSGARTEWTWDRRSEIVEKKLATGVVVRATYDANRRIVRLEEGSMVTLTEYGGMAWPFRITRPGGDVWLQRYDPMGNRVAVVNPRGQVFRIEHDHAGRVIAFTTFEGQRTAIGRDVHGDETYLDTVLGRFAIERDEEQRITTVEAPDHSISFVRGKTDALELVDNGRVPIRTAVDLLGRVVEERQAQYRTEVSWAGGEVSGIATDVGLPIRYTHDTTGELSRIEAGSTVVGVRQPQGGDFLTSLGDHLILRESFGENGRLAQRTLARRSGVVSPQEAATFDDPNVILAVSYEYDDKMALRREERSDGTVIEYRVDAGARITDKLVYRRDRLESQEHLDYDVAGTPHVQGARYDALGRPVALGDEELAYDVAGRLVERRTPQGTWRYEWNSLDQLLRVRAPAHVVEMEYDARGRRMRKRVLRQNEVVSSTFYVWANDMVIHEVDELDRSTRTYLRPNETWDIHGHVDLAAGTETATFYLTNPVGGIDCAVDASGKIVWAGEQTIFGRVAPAVSDVDVSVRFPNQHDDPDVGLVYNRWRWYDPRLGVYVSQDPWLLEGTPNPRDYTENPLLFIDPLGLASKKKKNPHPGFGDGTGNDGFHPLPKDSPTAIPPGGLAGADTKYMAGKGAWATAGTKDIPGFDSCPTGALHSGSGFGNAQKVVNKAGNTYGCHSCGAKKSGHPDGDDHWVCDHQPPKCTYSKTNSPANKKQASSANVKLYPHCYNCKQLQAGKLNGSVPKKTKADLGKDALDNPPAPPKTPPPPPKKKPPAKKPKK